MIARGADSTEAMTTIGAVRPRGWRSGAVALPHPRARWWVLVDAAPSSPEAGDQAGFGGRRHRVRRAGRFRQRRRRPIPCPCDGHHRNISVIAFMTPGDYTRTFGEEPDNLTVYARSATTDEALYALREPCALRGRGGHRGLQRRSLRLLQARMLRSPR